jgi:hypothetical protein
LHGRNTGNEFATSFSNSAQSLLKSSFDFMLQVKYTVESMENLRLDGLEKGLTIMPDRALLLAVSSSLYKTIND